MQAAARRERSRGGGRVPAVLIATALLAGACGSSTAGHPSAGATGVTAATDVALNGNGAEQRLTLHVGDAFHLVVPPGAQVSELGVHELADRGGDVYQAVGVGTATLEVTRRPSCAPGALCSNLIQLVGTVRVTIKS